MINFLKGSLASLPSTREAGTLYFVEDQDNGQLWLGNYLIGKNYNGKISAIETLIGSIPSTATAENIVAYISEAIDNKVGTLTHNGTTYNTVVDYVTAKTSGIATDATVAGKADKCPPAKANNIAVLATDGSLADGGKTIAEIEAAIESAEGAANDYTDNKLTEFLSAYITSDGNAIDKLQEIADWIDNDKDGVADILATIDGKQAALDNAQLAAVNSGITVTKVSEYDTVKATVDNNKATWDKAATAVQPEVIGVKANTEGGPSGIYADIQGATNNTVKDCVDAINTMNSQVGDTIGAVQDIVAQLTWGSF